MSAVNRTPGRRPQYPIELDKDNSLIDKLVTYIPASLNNNETRDLAGNRFVSLTAFSAHPDPETGWASVWDNPSAGDDSASFTDGFSTSSPAAYTYLSVAKFNTTPLSVGWRQVPVMGITSDSAGFSWDHLNVLFRQAAFHQESDSNYVAAKLTSTMPTDEWVWIAGRWDGTNLEAYFNGLQEVSTATDGTIQALVGNTEYPTSSDILHEAQVALFAVWERALTDEELFRLYHPATRWDFEIQLPKLRRRGMVAPAAVDLSHVAALADSFDNVVQRRPIKVTNF